MIFKSISNAMRVLNSLELILEVVMFQQELLREIADNQGIAFGDENEKKLERVQREINEITTWRRV